MSTRAAADKHQEPYAVRNVQQNDEEGVSRGQKGTPTTLHSITATMGVHLSEEPPPPASNGGKRWFTKSELMIAMGIPPCRSLGCVRQLGTKFDRRVSSWQEGRPLGDDVRPRRTSVLQMVGISMHAQQLQSRTTGHGIRSNHHACNCLRTEHEPRPSRPAGHLA